jgi:hypothetical protein
MRCHEVGGVCVSASSLSECDRGRSRIAVARPVTGEVRLCHGFLAAHPLLLATFGAVLLGVGLVGAWGVAAWLLRGGTLQDVVLLLIWAGPIGGWFLYDASRRGYYLAVRTRHGWQKLVFAKGTSREAIEGLLRSAEAEFGYAIERCC